MRWGKQPNEDAIVEIGVDDEGRLYVCPQVEKFEHIYRTAMGLHWDPRNRRLHTTSPGDWTYRQWFEQILTAVSGEYGIRLTLSPKVKWTNVPDSIQADIMMASPRPQSR